MIPENVVQQSNGLENYVSLEVQKSDIWRKVKISESQ